MATVTLTLSVPTTPNVPTSMVDIVKAMLDMMTDEDRHSVFGYYCKACGSKDENCQCWNDE